MNSINTYSNLTFLLAADSSAATTEPTVHGGQSMKGGIQGKSLTVVIG